MNKKDLSEADIKAKFITPAILKAGWDEMTQLGREKCIHSDWGDVIPFTDGRIQVRGKKTQRGKKKFADYILYYKPNLPIAIIEAKDNKKTIRSGIQQALGYATTLDIPLVFSSNGDGFLFHDKTATDGKIEKELGLDEFPSPQELWNKYKQYKGIEDEETEKIVTQDYYVDNSGKSPRYYQQIAINRTIEAIAKGQQRILLTMATGTGKTYTAFQIIWRLWKSGAKKRILFLADRTSLVDQTAREDFAPFKDAMTIIKNKKIDKAYNIYLALYQGITDSQGGDAYKQFSHDFFDLIIIDECHRGSARENSEWRKILSYFKKATHLGLTATPKETKEVSNFHYFGDPIYTYSLKEGIDDGFLAPYKVIKVTLDIDAEGWRPPKGFLDKEGNPVEDRIYNRIDFDKNIVVEERREKVAEIVSEYLKATDRMAKSIIFCVDIEHAEGMRSAFINVNSDLFLKNNKYVMQITGDNKEGKDQLDNFKSPSEPYPVITTTSKLLTTGVNIPTCKVIVLDSNIGSMTEFKQIIGRGTRINEEHNKTYFTVIDFRNATDHFADPNFNGNPAVVRVISEGDSITDIENEGETENGDDGSKVTYPIPQGGGEIMEDTLRKIRVDGVDVELINQRVQYLDINGKLITESLQDYTKKNVVKHYTSQGQFMKRWNVSEKKKLIIEELEEQGIFLEALQEQVGKDFDPFDLICHIVYDAKPLTRRERADNVKKRNYFTKYGDKAQAVINSLLDKYAVDGLLTIESMEVLKLDPLNKIGSPREIVNAFGGRTAYLDALKELENELYKVA